MATLSQRLIWTAVPAGLADGGKTLRVDVLVSFRLSVTGAEAVPLSAFPAIRSWADTLNACAITVRLDGEPRPTTRLAAADPADWRALLPPSTPVRGHRFDDFRGKRVLSYPMAVLGRAIEADYVELALEAGDDLPELARLRKRLQYPASREEPGAHAERLLGLVQRLRTDKKPPDRQFAIDLLAAYHRPLEAEAIVTQEKARLPDGTPDPADPHERTRFRTHARVPLPAPSAWRDLLDFHRIVSALGQHPAVMRRIGLVVPLAVPRGSMADGPHSLLLDVAWETGGIGTEPDVLPTTHARLGAGRFLPAPRGPMLREGFLRAGHPAFDLLLMDVDGAGLKLRNLGRSALPPSDERQDEDAAAPPPPERAGAPRLRTAGLQLVHRSRHRAIETMFADQGTLDDLLKVPGAHLNLFAEDLLRGWRVDVQAEGGPWQSLMRCRGTYALVNEGRQFATADEEGMVRIAAAAPADGSLPDILKVSEAVFAWSGWSLAAPEPGRALMPDDETHAEGPNEAPPGLPLVVHHRVEPRSLPVLRFGRRYWVRLRAVDVTGGGPGWSPADAGVAGIEAGPVVFGRLEPVEAPPLALVEGDPLPADGESLGRAAIRSMDEAAASTTSVRRLAVPPRVGQRFAELHGVVDGPDGRPDPARYALLTGRDAPFAEVTVETRAWDPEGSADGGAAVRTPYPVHPAGAPTPWLDDPLATGLAVRILGLPGVDPSKVWKLPFHGGLWDPVGWPAGWPDARPVLFRADATAGEVAWDAETRALVVPLAPAERARLRISALVPRQGLKLFRLVERIRARPDGAAKWQAIEKRVRAGQHWMFTPWRTLELVHATQRPLIAPDFQVLGATRAAGDPAATITFVSPIHAKSTQRLDARAEWIEIDDTGPGGPTTRRIEAPAFSVSFHRLDHPKLVTDRLAARHVLADTRARRIAYTPVGTTRFREFMPHDIRADAARLTRAGPARWVWVPASSAPPPPVIRHLVPTFGWQTVGKPGGGRSVWRTGGGLRVYLERPWFASGTNEMLAVLLPRGAADPQAGPARAFVTQWGADPLWPGGKVSSMAPPRTAFPLGLAQGPVPTLFEPPATGEAAPPDPRPDGTDAGGPFPVAGLAAPGMPQGLLVDAVPHAVGYAADLGLWYADIVVRPVPGYFPFIRLALARYQPNAIPGCHLSPVVMASFQQLAPDRVATVTPLPGGRLRVEIRGRLPAARGRVTALVARPRAGIVSIELQRLAQGGNPDFDWETVALPAGKSPMPASSVPQPARPRLQAADLRRARLDLARGDLARIAEQPGVLEALMPPVILMRELALPTSRGYRWRLLVTESEQWSTDPTGRVDGLKAPERIVYAVALDL